MKSMFRPIKKIFTYIQKNASNGTMFGTTTTNTTTTITGPVGRDPDDDDVAASSNSCRLHPELEEDDIERQIKTSIIDASKVQKMMLPLEVDDELADFANEPVTMLVTTVEEVEEDELEEQYLELDNFPNNEIIVLSENELNSSLASDNISEDPLAIEDFAQPLAPDEDIEEDGIENNGELLWLKLDGPMPVATADNVPAVVIATTSTDRTRPTKTKEEELLRSDGGSDSGLGSENDRHNTIPTAITTSSTPEATTTTTTTEITTDITATIDELPSTTLPKPLRSNLKRRLDEDAIELGLVPELNSSGSSSCLTGSAQKRSKRSINFDNVKVYYFPRQQGFNCVPTAGGCTLGMGARHIATKTMTLAEHAAELRRAHRSQNQQENQQSLRTGLGSSSDESEESEEDYLSEGSGSDADDGSSGFLQPVTPKQRRALLKAAGVRKIDASEKIDCRDIRNSREVCGCSCREFCDPETCACSQAGIKCQVDRAMFPCGCTREACGNTVGRVEFNPTRVRTHYIHTVMRLDMEQRQSQGPPVATASSSLVYGGNSGNGNGAATSPVAAIATASSSSSSSHCYFMQPQSNYSSGYASPAYTPESSVSYYQQQQQQQTPQGAAGSPVAKGASATQTVYAASYPQLDSLDSGLFTTGSNATPSYGELLTPTYHHQTLSYDSTQISSYSYSQTASTGDNPSPSAYSSCAVPSVPPFGIATTTAANTTQYQHTNVDSESSVGSITSLSIAGGSCSTVLGRLSGSNGPTDFINLSSPIGSSSRLSQINDLLQHNRNTTAALVAVSENYAEVSRTGSCSRNSNSSITDSIDTPPIMEEPQRSCMAFEELPPPPLINPTPIVAVLDQQQQQQQQHHQMAHKQLMSLSSSGPHARQPLDTSVVTESSTSTTI